MINDLKQELNEGWFYSYKEMEEVKEVVNKTFFEEDISFKLDWEQQQSNALNGKEIIEKLNNILAIKMIGLNRLAAVIHKNAADKGFWDGNNQTGTMFMLIVSELSEALEADRKGRRANMELIDAMVAEGKTWESAPEQFAAAFEAKVKDSFEDEIADTIIRLFDYVGAHKIDLESHIKHKLEYNKQRPFKHGKAY